MANHPPNRMNSERRKVAKLQTQKLDLLQNPLAGKVADEVDAPAPQVVA